MSDVAVYMIANLVVEDADEYRKYEQGFFPILKRFGGEFITFDDNHETLEGSTPTEAASSSSSFPRSKSQNSGIRMRSIRPYPNSAEKALHL